MNQREAKRERQRIQSNREELVERMARALPEDGILEVFPGLFLARSSQPTEKLHSIFKPAFCVIAQGTKQVLLGAELLRYDPGHYLISTVDLPLVSRVVEASEKKPYFSFRLNLDGSLVSSVMMESGVEIKKGDARVKAIDVRPIDINLLDAVVRLARLLDTPDEIQALARLIIREIVYRLLRGEQGARLSHLLTSGGDTHRISKAVKHLHEHFDRPISMEGIARELGMSVSGFHHHFKSVTAMSPLQFQKQIRLQEARRLMLGEDLDAASAGFRVGYEDPAYFSREYKKLFGAPPQRDIARLRRTLLPQRVPPVLK
ncbi:MAG TPA: AraC family transcriptional regulator [Blastocatellia bacterium]|nr:AraC family transcriptional regulator [Blastocatellia bacterium]